MSASFADRRELDTPPSDDIVAELALWKHLAFVADMPPTQEKRPDGQSSDERIATSQSSQFQTPPPQAYNYLIHALLSRPPAPAPPYPYPPYGYPWPPQIPPESIAGPSSLYPPPHDVGSSQLGPLPGPSTGITAAQDPEGAEDPTVITEDKRRRNTAASARFRAKKKVKTLNLERTVADLTGRTEELEREATDLRRENTWLKEIVLLKGRNIATMNLGSQASATNRHDQEQEEGESDTEASAKRGGKGKDKQS